MEGHYVRVIQLNKVLCLVQSLLYLSMDSMSLDLYHVISAYRNKNIQ